MARRLKSGFLVIVFLGVATFGGFFWWLGVQGPVQPAFSPQANQDQQIFVIKKGEGLDEIALCLQKEGLVRSAFAFRLAVMAKNLTQQIQAGDFRLHPGMDLAEIIDQLTHGTLDVWVTIPEGWRQEQIAQKLINEGFEIDLADWEQEVNNSNLEGFLFPDTYLIPKDATAGAITKIMSNNFDKKTESVLSSRIQSSYSLNQVITLASLVEREVRTDQDRPLVAGIIFKRWQSNWPLQVDAAVQYVVGSIKCEIRDSDCNWWSKNLTKQDLQINSPYNTYQFRGLPPAPICNPGLASIKAALSYQESPYWFYLSDSSGQMHYAETIADHNANIAKYLGN